MTSTSHRPYNYTVGKYLHTFMMSRYLWVGTYLPNLIWTFGAKSKAFVGIAHYRTVDCTDALAVTLEKYVITFLTCLYLHLLYQAEVVCYLHSARCKYLMQINCLLNILSKASKDRKKCLNSTLFIPQRACVDIMIHSSFTKAYRRTFCVAIIVMPVTTSDRADGATYF